MLLPPNTREELNMESQEVFLTTDGLHRAMSQLEFLRTTKRAEVAQYLHDAKESGDVIDNAAYEEAKTSTRTLKNASMNWSRCWPEQR